MIWMNEMGIPKKNVKSQVECTDDGAKAIYCALYNKAVHFLNEKVLVKKIYSPKGPSKVGGH